MGKGKRKKEKREINVRETHRLDASCMHPDLGWGQTFNQVVALDQESNLWPSSPLANILTAEQHQPGWAPFWLVICLYYKFFLKVRIKYILIVSIEFLWVQFLCKISDGHIYDINSAALEN